MSIPTCVFSLSHSLAPPNTFPVVHHLVLSSSLSPLLSPPAIRIGSPDWFKTPFAAGPRGWEGQGESSLSGSSSFQLMQPHGDQVPPPVEGGYDQAKWFNHLIQKKKKIHWKVKLTCYPYKLPKILKLFFPLSLSILLYLLLCEHNPNWRYVGLKWVYLINGQFR